MDFGYRSPMREPQSDRLTEFAFHSENDSPGVVRRVRIFCRALTLVLTLMVCATAIAAAQTRSTKAGEIHDHLQKAEAYLKAKDPNSAAKEFDAVLALDPKNAEAYANLGVIAFSGGDCQSAAQKFRKALAIEPSLAKTQALLGTCERRLGDPSARAVLEKAFSTLKDKQLRLQVGMELVALYDEVGEPDATATVMRSLVDLDPDNVDVLFMAQRLYSELADDTLNKLAILAPGSARMQQVIAERLVNGGDLKNAIDHYRKALQIDPRLPGVHFELAEAILQTAPADAATQADAEKELEAAVTVDGNSARTECEFGSIAMSQGRMEKAFAHYQRAYQLNPNEVLAQMGLAKLLMLQDKPQEAVKYLLMAVQLDPLNGAAHYRLGSAYKRLQMTEMARKEMELSQEIKKAKDQVEDLYRQMNRQSKPEIDATPDTGTSDQ
jgi:tetratricopeptide (TPR) repeat protein